MKYKTIAIKIARDYNEGKGWSNDYDTAEQALVYRYGGTNTASYIADFKELHPSEWAMLEELGNIE